MSNTLALEEDQREEEPQDADTHFLKRCRLTKDAFYHLCNVLKEYTELRKSQRVSLETKVLSALSSYANGEYQKVIGIANNLSQEAISRYVQQVTEALNHPNMINRFITFPKTPEDRLNVAQNFYDCYGIPGVIGCVGSSHFRIFKPHRNEEHLYRRHNYHSLNVQMVADSKGRIIYVNPKFGGATHDAFIWEYSRINKIMESLYQNGESVWLLGDSKYPQRPWLMTPYSHPSPNTAEETYNYIQSKTRVVVENTFGCLKNRWRCLGNDIVLHYKPSKCAKIIIACSVLHNIALDYGVPDPENQHNCNQEINVEVPEPEENSSLLTAGLLLRDRLATRLHADAM